MISDKNRELVSSELCINDNSVKDSITVYNKIQNIISISKTSITKLFTKSKDKYKQIDINDWNEEWWN